MRLSRIFNRAVPLLEGRSLSESRNEAGIPLGYDVPESAILILKNYEVLREDLHYLNNLLVISRNMLAIKDTAQELCAASHFHSEVHKLIDLAVNVTSKGYDGENVVDADRGKLLEITELCKLCPYNVLILGKKVLTLNQIKSCWLHACSIRTIGQWAMIGSRCHSGLKCYLTTS